MKRICYRPIGVLHTPFRDRAETPRNAVEGLDYTGVAEVFPRYAAGLADLDGFSHLILVFHLHRITEHPLRVRPVNSEVERGVFATRSPARPNPIGISVVRLVAVEANRVVFRGVDMLDGTPLLDIKPYLGSLLPGETVRRGWLESSGDRHRAADVTE